MKRTVQSGKRLGPLPMILLVLGILTWASPAPAEETSAREILQCLQAGLEGFRGLTLDYEREILTSSSAALLGGAGGGDHASGHMDFKPPRFLKISQETPRPETVVTDGQTLWWYIPEKREARRYSADAMGKEMEVLADVLQGLRDAEEDFELIQEGHTETGDHRIRLVPEPPWSQTDHINLEITTGCRLRVVEFHNTAGNVTRFVLGPPQEHETFEEGHFSFSVPEGVRVVDEAP